MSSLLKTRKAEGRKGVQMPYAFDSSKRYIIILDIVSKTQQTRLDSPHFTHSADHK